MQIYQPSALPHLIEKYHISIIVLAIPSTSKWRKSEIVQALNPFDVKVMFMPVISEKMNELREIDITDLLGRDAVDPEKFLLSAKIEGKVVMVTGAGGSIGSELCRQILRLKPELLILFEINEYALYAIEKDLVGSTVKIIPILGPVTNTRRCEKTCRAFKVQTIYHAAAYKHVPLVEQNPGEAISNNVFGTPSMALAAINADVETFVLVSTDKAVRPTNTMGATKRFAELILQALQSNSTCFSMVRFGNVLGSSGSVVPLFKEQIARGGPITITDERIIRYFMTIPEAVELVIQAGAMGTGGDVFVLDMGEPVRIVDLAKRMVSLSGLQIKDLESPDGDIEIKFTGLRYGEKLYEELLIGDNALKTSHPRIMRAEEYVISWPELKKMLVKLENAVQEDNFELARKVLSEAVSGFEPQCGIEDLLWKKENI